MRTVQENLAYKTEDHRFRSVDEYAQGKYDITTRWLRPSIQPGQLLLNVGCGSGEYNATASSMGLRVIACEPEVEAFSLALSSAPANVDVRQCGLLDLDSEPADYLVMHDVLEHIEDDAQAVAKVHSLLAPGGTAIISVPAYQWLFGRHDVELGHFRRYTRTSLVQLLRGTFVIERARYYGAALIPVALWFSRIRNKPYPVASASTGIGRAVLRSICQIESQIPLPAGTSVVVRARRVD